MANYLDNFDFDTSKIKAKAQTWKLDFSQKILKEIPKYFRILTLFFIISITSFLIIPIIATVIYLSLNQNIGLLIFLILSWTLWAILLMGGIIWTIIQKSRIKIIISKINLESEVDIYKEWFSNSFNHEELSNRYQKLFSIAKPNFRIILENYRYKTMGQTQVGVSKIYNLMGGTIFNNPFNLACGVWHSFTQSKDARYDFYEYMPVLQIKTNYFLDAKIEIINSKRFPKFKKNTIMFENSQFRELFSVKTNDPTKTLMVFTALIQEKWVSLYPKGPKFKMTIENGMITVLFQGFNKSNKWTNRSTRKPFMNIIELYNFSWSLKSFLKQVDQKIINDIEVFVEMVNYIFSISYFQWENLEDGVEKR